MNIHSREKGNCAKKENQAQKKVVFLTGATGAMGSETLLEFCRRLDRFELRLLVRPSKKNRKAMKRYEALPGVSIIWGDLLNRADVAKGVENADFVIHMGGMVSPLADHFPKKTLHVNVEAARILVDEIKKSPDPDKVHLVYIGSVAMTSCREIPHHWGRTGDPVISAPYDYYSVSKILGERIVAESGLRYWVSLRQSGILHKGLVAKGKDPITFHVPINGVLEWTTVEDSARCMANLCEEGVPESFWRGFYNIGSGEAFRLTNMEFERLLMKTLHCPPPEKVFEASWFATRNFHGMWFEDSDKLEEILHFREKTTAEAYFRHLASRMPWWVNLSPLAPAFLIKAGMKMVAKSKNLGTLDWLGRSDCEGRIKAYFKSREDQAKIPSWKDFEILEPSKTPVTLCHGYDESKPEECLDLDDMRKAAEFRGGKCLSAEMKTGNLDTPLEWECAFGHKFTATPRLILKGGHWCPDCMPAPWRYDEEAKRNPFLAQVWHDSHSPDENETYQ